jgi:phosphatidylserine synthase
VTRLYANLATLANGLCGIGAILYLLAGNKLWAGLLIVSGLGFDGLDGYLSRRAGGGAGSFGRVADSVSDAVTFGVAPAALLVVHTDQPSLWAPWQLWADAAALVLLSLAIARLTYFTLRGYQHKDFLGVPTPQTALAVVALSLWTDLPGFGGVHPPVLLGGALLAAVLMVVPIPFPKIRRGAPLRFPMTVTAVALVAAEIPLQFRPASGTPLYDLCLGATVVASVGLLLYYLVGPFTVAKPVTKEG